MENIQQEFNTFISDLETKLKEVDLTLVSFPIDHVCYRASSIKEYELYFPIFSKASKLYTTKFFHERTFHLFVLKEPFTYKNISISLLEFAQPGGSDEYDRGFQHIEFLTNLDPHNIVIKEKHGLFKESSHGDEQPYLKWSDKTAVKFAVTSLLIKSLLEDNPSIMVNN